MYITIFCNKFKCELNIVVVAVNKIHKKKP